MNRIKTCIVGLAMLACVGTMSPAYATWLGLGDGTYDVTLTCVFSSIIPCPSTTHGILTIANDAATDFDFIVNGQTFVGTPGNSTFSNSVGSQERAEVDLAPFAFLALLNFTSGGFQGLTPHTWIYCNNVGSNTCTPNTIGNWAAVAVPEPPSIALLVAALGIMGAAGIARGRRT